MKEQLKPQIFINRAHHSYKSINDAVEELLES